MIRLVVVMVAALMLVPGHALARADCEEFYNKLMQPQNDASAVLESGEIVIGFNRLTEHVRKLNDCLKRRPLTTVVSVENLDPYWWRLRLNEAAKTASQPGVSEPAAAITVCGGSLWPCDEAKQQLRQLTRQCSRVFLGIIDISNHPDFPEDVFHFTDSPIKFFTTPEGSATLEETRLTGRVNENNVAIILCPLESHSVGHVYKFFKGVQ